MVYSTISKAKRVYLIRRIDSQEKKESKSERRMPWLPEAMKDVVSCDKARGFANRI